MAEVPFYWYIETDTPSEVFEPLPIGVFGPCPTITSDVAFDKDTGEIHGEAILMRALPWPRFRSFVDGKQLHLPYWGAIALERLELVMGRTAAKDRCACGIDHGDDRRSHLRVEILDAERYAVTVWDNSHFENAFPSRYQPGFPRPASPACPPGEGRRGPVKGSEGRVALAPLRGGGASYRTWKLGAD